MSIQTLLFKQAKGAKIRMRCSHCGSVGKPRVNILTPTYVTGGYDENAGAIVGTARFTVQAWCRSKGCGIHIENFDLIVPVNGRVYWKNLATGAPA